MSQASKRLKISIESYVANDVIELQEVEPRVKLAPKHTADDDFLDALNHVSYHRIVEGLDDQLAPKQTSRGPTFQPDLSESLRELDELLQLLQAIASSPPALPGAAPSKFLELHNVHHEERSEIEDLQAIAHSRKQHLRDAASLVRRASVDLKRCAVEQRQYTDRVLCLQHEDGLLRLPAPRSWVDLEVPYKALECSLREDQLWQALNHCVQRLTPNTGLAVTYLGEDVICVELTNTSSILCRRTVQCVKDWNVTSVDFKTSVRSLTSDYIHALFSAALLRYETAVQQDVADAALTLRPSPTKQSKFHLEMEKVLLHVQHAAYLHQLHEGLRYLRRDLHIDSEGDSGVHLCECRPLQWPNCSAYRLMVGKDSFPLSVVGTICHIRTDVLTLSLPALDILQWIANHLRNDSSGTHKSLA